MSRIRLLSPRHLLVFTVRGKQKFKGLYTPQRGYYADYFELQPVWVAEMGQDCGVSEEGVGVGSKCFIIDSYELEHIPSVFDWYAERNPEAFKPVWDLAQETGGFIDCNIIHEASLVGVEVS